MDKIEQAREVSSRIWNAGYTDESATIDALIAELEKVTREAHENKDKARWANAELERIKSQEPVAWMTQSGNPVLYKSAEQAVLYGWNPLFLAAGAQSIPDGYQLVPVEPTAGMKTAAIGVEVYADSPPELGALTWHEASAIYKAMLAAAPQAQPVQQEPAAWEHCFVDPSKKILSYTKTCAGFPPRDDAYQINPLYAHPVQAQERTCSTCRHFNGHDTLCFVECSAGYSAWKSIEDVSKEQPPKDAAEAAKEYTREFMRGHDAGWGSCMEHMKAHLPKAQDRKEQP